MNIPQPHSGGIYTFTVSFLSDYAIQMLQSCPIEQVYATLKALSLYKDDNSNGLRVEWVKEGPKKYHPSLGLPLKGEYNAILPLLQPKTDNPIVRWTKTGISELTETLEKHRINDLIEYCQEIIKEHTKEALKSKI